MMTKSKIRKRSILTATKNKARLVIYYDGYIQHEKMTRIATSTGKTSSIGTGMTLTHAGLYRTNDMALINETGENNW